MDASFYNIKRLHVVFAVASAALVAATVWMMADDHFREWKVYQRTYREEIEPQEGQSHKPLEVNQIWLPDLTIDYNFCKVARFDRCRTCHAGIDETALATVAPDVSQPYCPHPRLDLFVGSQSPHPANEFGCTICHDGQGSATAFEHAAHSPNTLTERARWRDQYDWRPSRFWDYPMLASRFSESRCLKCHFEVTDLEPSRRFPDPPAAKLVEGYNLVRENGCFGCHEIRGVTEDGRRVGPDMRLEPKGTMRKVGPTLRHVADKLDATFLDAWNRDPAEFRPATRMPQFFGMYAHLSGKPLSDAQRFEAVEIRAIGDYLLAASEPLEPLAAVEGVTQPPSAERGRTLFQTQGCLGCHQHVDFPDAQSTFGPDLTNLGGKLSNDAGRAWLVDWIRDPHRYDPNTLMPKPQWGDRGSGSGDQGTGGREEEDGAQGNPAPSPQPLVPPATDAAADIAAYLLGSDDWQPGPRPPLVESDLDELALLHLAKVFPADEAERYLAEGIPESLSTDLPADERELVGPITLDKKLRYVGRSTIRKRGCFGCHDIPGFEDAQPIGPALSEWGRKQESLLAFDHVAQFLSKEDKTADSGTPADRAFYEQAVEAGRREGFIWQKLRAPRSFDYEVAATKGYNQRLTMGHFSLTPAQREAIITFVLGLVAEPPASKYVYQPDERTGAIVEGRKVLDKYGCAQCHTMAMERWTFQYDPEEYYPPPSMPDFPFMEPKFSEAELAASLATDAHGLAHAEVVGMPRLDASGRVIEDVDEDDNPLYFFTLWEPAAIAGQACQAGGADVMIAEPQIIRREPPWGGALARLLFPVAVDWASQQGSTATAMEAFGWLPPPLGSEGAKVQPNWLYRYLLNPTPIRPAAMLRMPTYNLSPDEAAALVDYFVAASSPRPLAGEGMGVRAPSLQPSVTEGPWPALAGQGPLPDTQRLDQAMRLVTDRVTFCAKCHQIGDYSPGDAVRTSLAPNLADVGRRIRPDYLRRWLANPKSELPYTGMPVNFPPGGKPLGQDLLPGTSIEQIDTIRSLLLNYDEYIKSRMSIRRMME